MPIATYVTTLYESLGGEPSAPAPTCAHVFLTGRRCPRLPAEGETVCVLHGASIVRATDVIRRKLLALQEKSITVAEELMEFGEDKVKATVVVAIWDRTGLGPKSTVEVQETSDVSSLSDEELAVRHEQAARRLRLRSLTQAQRTHEDATVNETESVH